MVDGVWGLISAGFGHGRIRGGAELGGNDDGERRSELGARSIRPG